MGDKTAAAKQIAAALTDLWKAQDAGDQAAQQAALDRGHGALRGTTAPAAR